MLSLFFVTVTLFEEYWLVICTLSLNLGCLVLFFVVVLRFCLSGKNPIAKMCLLTALYQEVPNDTMTHFTVVLTWVMWLRWWVGFSTVSFCFSPL